MAQHFKIEIRVSYDTAYPIPDDMAFQLTRNVDLAVRCGLLNDADFESVVETWDAEVTCAGARRLGRVYSEVG